MIKGNFLIPSALAVASLAGVACAADVPSPHGDLSWTGRPRHLAVVNPVCRPADDPYALSLAGLWDFAPCPLQDYRCRMFSDFLPYLGDRSLVKRIRVPGCWEASGAISGEALSNPWGCRWDMSQLTIRGFHQGGGWYARTVKIPAAWKGRRIWFKPGWAHCVGSSFIDRKPVSMEYGNFCGTYKYDVTDLVTPGRDAFVVILANNAAASFRGSYSFINKWGGIVRAPEFEATPADAWIDEAWVRGDFDRRMAQVNVEIGGAESSPRQKAGRESRSAADGPNSDLVLRATIDGVVAESPIKQSNNPNNQTIMEIPLRDFRAWSPERPNLYTAKVELVSSDGAVLQTRYERFGVRKIERRGRKIYLNNRPVFLRGAGWHDVCPIEGAAPCDRAYWLRTGRRVREAGFNYIRLHTSARSPEFFEACDELGLMVQPELPYYNDTPCDHQRFDPLADAEELYLAYRRHPSFVVYSGGNEGTFGPRLGKALYEAIKARDPDRLVLGQDSYPYGGFNEPGTSDLASGPVVAWPRGTYTNEMPFVTHEYMNLSVKLDSRLEKKFTGVWVTPITRQSRAEFLAASGLSLPFGDRLQEAQHALQATWRKYGLESARLDPDCDGYLFWSLQDVCVKNKGTPAAQALFDPFWGDKPGGETTAGVAVYNSPSCVLLRDGNDPDRYDLDLCRRFNWPRVWPRVNFVDSMVTNRVRRSGDTLRARIHFAHYESDDLTDAKLGWKLTSADGRILAQGAKALGTVPVGGVREIAAADIVIPALEKATRATLTATVSGFPKQSDNQAIKQFSFSNSWDYWFFPARLPRTVEGVACADDLRPSLAVRYPGLLSETDWTKAKTVIVRRDTDLETAALKAGRNVISLSGQSGKSNIQLGWWWMGSQMGSAVNDHPWLDGFPHQSVLSPLFFRIGKSGLKLPVAGVSEKDLIMVGEGHEACYLYLAETKSSAGGRVCHISGLDVLTDTPEGTALLDGALRRCQSAPLASAALGAAPRPAADVRSWTFRHPRFVEVQLMDATDCHNELWDEREYLLFGNEAAFTNSAPVVYLEDASTGEGTVFVRMGPLPHARADRRPDYCLDGVNRTLTFFKTMYPLVERKYSGGRPGRIRVMQEIQREIRPYVADRDGLFLTNTWGDHHRDASINEAFMLREVEAGAELGVDVIQIDDGWQKGRSCNSAEAYAGRVKGNWGTWWDVPGFWDVDPVRFPNGLKGIVGAARRRGMKFGLWFGPDSGNEAVLWERDADFLLKLHREQGIDFFKLDSLYTPTQLAFDRQRALMKKLMDGSNRRIVVDLDVTAGVRPGYFSFPDIGPLFVENRYADDRRQYWPHLTLRSVWSLAHVVDPVRLRMEVLNPERRADLWGDDPLAPVKYPRQTLFAIAMAASPLGWFEIQNLSRETVDAWKPLVATWKAHRASWFGGTVYPVGDRPDGRVWTGFVSVAGDGRSGSALLFRELDRRTSFALDLTDLLSADLASAETIAGRGSARTECRRLVVSNVGQLDFVWVKFACR